MELSCTSHHCKHPHNAMKEVHVYCIFSSYCLRQVSTCLRFLRGNAAQTLLGALSNSWVLLFLPFLFSCKCFHLLLFPWVCPGLCRRCFRSLFQTCSQNSSIVFRLGWLMSCMKSLYQTFWLGVMLLDISLVLEPSPSSSLWRSSSKWSVSMTSRVTLRSVCMNPCSTAWHR